MKWLMHHLLCLTLLMAGPAGKSSAGSCCEANASPRQAPSAAGCCSTPDSACCCSGDHSAKATLPQCCHPNVEAPSVAAAASSPADSKFESGCGGENCPCSTQSCCKSIGSPVLYVAAGTNSFSFSPQSALMFADDQQLSRCDLPAVPPPKVL